MYIKSNYPALELVAGTKSSKASIPFVPTLKQPIGIASWDELSTCGSRFRHARKPFSEGVSSENLAHSPATPPMKVAQVGSGRGP